MVENFIHFFSAVFVVVVLSSITLLNNIAFSIKNVKLNFDMLIIIFHISMDNCRFAPTPLCMFVFAYIYVCVHVFVYSICVCVCLCVNLYSFRLRFYLTRNVQFYSVLFCFFRLQCEHVYVWVCAVYMYGVCVCLWSVSVCASICTPNTFASLTIAKSKCLARCMFKCVPVLLSASPSLPLSPSHSFSSPWATGKESFYWHDFWQKRLIVLHMHCKLWEPPEK